MLPQSEISKQVLKVVSDVNLNPTKQYVGRLIKESKNSSEEASNLIKQTMTSIANILKDPEIHPKIKLQVHRIVMYLILMADLEIYEEFLHTVYGIFRVNCMYNKGAPVQVKGQDFFKKSKFFTDPNATAIQKNEIKKIGASYIIFCLETVYMLAKWLPYDLQDDTKPTKFFIAYQSLRRQGIEFPKQQNFQFYNNPTVEQIQKVIRDIEKQYESMLGSQIRSTGPDTRTVPHSLPLDTEVKKVRSSQNRRQSSILRHDVSNDMESKNKIFLLEDQKNKLLKQIQIQRNFFQNQLQKQRKTHQDTIFLYQKKILKLQQQIQKLQQKIHQLQSKPHQSHQPQQSQQTLAQSQSQSQQLQLQQKKSQKEKEKEREKERDKFVEELQMVNKELMEKVRKLEGSVKRLEGENLEIKGKVGGEVSGGNQSVSEMSVEIEKLKKQNKSLKAKILTDCSQASQFSTKKSTTKTRNTEKSPQSLKFLGYEDARSNFQPFYSNSSSQLKTRLRKAILRQKQLLYRDKTLQIGCITKLQNSNTVRITTVFTNISEKPLFNFGVEFVCREDLTVKLGQNAKNYLEISGQTKCEIIVTVNQIDFRCLLCSIRFNIQQQIQKVALIMPISKLKLATQLVYTPITSPQSPQTPQKLQKVFQIDRKMLPNLHKFKDYFDQAILEVDRTMHQVYNLKIQFMGVKFYVECDQIQGELRIAVKYYREGEFSRAEKLLDQLVFLFVKN